MLQSRRGFLVGLGSLLTAAFVKHARSCIRTNGQPLLARPKQVAQTMYWYPHGDRYLLSLGEYMDEPPPAPSWRELLVRDGIAHQSKDEIENVWCAYGIWPEDYDRPVHEEFWWGRFDCKDGPCAKAYHLLDKIDFGPERVPHLNFYVGADPGDYSHWVDAKDELSLSLLQARLIDLKMPIRIVGRQVASSKLRADDASDQKYPGLRRRVWGAPFGAARD